MCDEYYDARMKAWWRAVEEEQADEEHEKENEEPIAKPILLDSVPRVTSKPKALTR